MGRLDFVVGASNRRTLFAFGFNAPAIFEILWSYSILLLSQNLFFGEYCIPSFSFAFLSRMMPLLATIESSVPNVCDQGLYCHKKRRPWSLFPMTQGLQI